MIKHHYSEYTLKKKEKEWTLRGLAIGCSVTKFTEMPASCAGQPCGELNGKFLRSI